jgi:hypothetical protein
MFDNLRDLSDSPLYEDEQDDFYKEPEASAATNKTASAKPAKSKKKNGNLMGMSSQQRFVIALMLMFTICLLGTLAMFVMGRMSLF